MTTRKVPTPLGILILTASDLGLERVDFAPDGVGCAGNPEPAHEGPAQTWLQQAVAWVRAYFDATELPALPTLAPAGTAFQQAVWQQLMRIPYGETTTYGRLALALGKPAAASRAIGQANGANPVPLLIPCHRVVAGGGQLGGYSCGLDRKRWLLTHEARHAPFRLRPPEPARGQVTTDG